MNHQVTMNNLLTAGIVEELHHAHSMGREIRSYLENYSIATLSGLIEYTLLNRFDASFPVLPDRISRLSLASELLDALNRVDSVSEYPRNSLKSISARDHEFFTFTIKDQRESDWELFRVRLQQSAFNAGFPILKSRAIAGAIHEMRDNALLHSLAPDTILVAYQVLESAFCCCICDLGIGVLKSLQSNAKYAQLATHNEAIRKSMEAGVTRLESGGFGFHTLFSALASLWGTLRLRSGEGCVTMDGTTLDATFGKTSTVLFRPGFQVSICCRSKTDDGKVLI